MKKGFIVYSSKTGNTEKVTRGILNLLNLENKAELHPVEAAPDPAEAEDVKKRVGANISKNNMLLGSFLCQGRIDPKLREVFEKFPEGHPHAMTPERIKRHQNAESHPDEADLRAAASACREMLEKVRIC